MHRHWGELDHAGSFDVLVPQDTETNHPGGQKPSPARIPSLVEGLHSLLQGHDHRWLNCHCLIRLGFHHRGFPLRGRHIRKVPAQAPVLGKPLQRVVCTIGSFGACLEKTIEIQSIRREDAVLLFHIDTKLSPRLQSIQDSRPLSLRDLLLGHPVEGALPLRVPLRGQLPLRPHHLCL